MKYPLNLLKQTSREDMNFIKGPIIALALFLVVALIIFPKPAKIYHGGVLKECACFGVKAVPNSTQGIGAGETYCLGIPIKCEKTQIMKN